MSDARSILQNHYKDASRLDARIQLHAKYSTNTQGLHSWVFEHLRLPPTCQVLEVGCGSGQLWLVNHHRLPTGWHVTLSDLSAGMLATAHRQLSPYGPLYGSWCMMRKHCPSPTTVLMLLLPIICSTTCQTGPLHMLSSVVS